MKYAPIDYTLTLRIILRGIDPPVERTLALGVTHTLADLHTAIQLAFDGTPSAHHAFCDEDPFPQGFPPTDEQDRSVWFTPPDRWRPRRRWGDDWTKIDLHDPTVIDECGQRLQDVFWGGSRLHYRSGDPFEPGEYAWFVIEKIDDDIALDGAVEGVRVLSGRHRSPLSLLSVRDYAEQLRAYANPDHPDHLEVVASLERAAGPWDEFDPAAFDPQALQLLFDRRWGRGAESFGARNALDALADELPAPTAAGLRRHIVQTGLHLPSLVTRDEAAAFVRPFTWLLGRSLEGLELVDDELPAAIVTEWVDATGIDPGHAAGLLRTARDLRLVRRLKGQLIPYKAAIPLADEPVMLWTHLADELLSAGRYSVPTTSALFALAIADGSVGADGPDGGLGRIARALDLRDHLHPRYDYDRWSGASRHRTPATVDGVLTAIAPLAARLAPLGLQPTSDVTWTATPLLRAFVHAALSTPVPPLSHPSWALREVY